MEDKGYDTRLRDAESAASRALLRMDEHEKLCAQRYSNIADNTESMMSSIEKTNALLLKVGLGLLATMGSILIKLQFFSP